MAAWQPKPFIYEINTWVWLDSLSRTHHYNVALNNVPEHVLDELGALNVDAVWLMGVWQHNPAGRTSALKYADEYRSSLPDLTDDDIVGSPYAIGDYEVDDRLGGRAGLAAFRAQLGARGLKLILDFVPNHVATDHPWVSAYPHYFVRGNLRDLKTLPDTFFRTRDAWGRTLVVGHGRDPYFPGWIDTAQLDAFSPGYRQAALETLLDIAAQCDGVRCDMAMLLVNKVFASTWAGYVDEAPEDEFWETIITQVKARFPHFLFAAEVYWGMEARLQQQGFDFTYDKLLYDRIVPGDVEKIRLHLLADIPFQKRSLRFIENHDEPRAAATLGEEIARPAAVLISTLPGAVLLHDGQLIGRRIKLPVQIRRQPEEPIDGSLLAYYRLLLAETRSSVYQTGEWQLLETHPAWGGNGTHEYLITYGWRNNDGESVTFRLIAINFTGEQAQAQVNLSSWPEIAEYNWCLHDVLNGDSFYHTADNLTRFGLYIDLPPYHAHIFAFDRVEGLLSNGTPGE